MGRRSWIFRLAVLWRRTWALSVCNPLCDVLVPLLLCAALEQTNDGDGHVVAANTASVAVGGQAVVHHVLADRGEVLLCHNSTPNELDDGLGRLYVPDA